MAITVKQNLVAKSKFNIKCPYEMEAEYITFHNTANDATSAGEVKFMIGNNNEVSYHFAVDDKEVVQGIPVNRNAWHCGDGKYGNGNRKSIGVEVCYSKSGGAKYEKAEALAIKFIAQLLHERGWGVDRVKRHQEWSGKYCPHRVLADGRWNDVKARIQAELDTLNGKKAVTPTPAPAVSKGYYKKGDKGEGIKYLQELLNKAGYNCGTADGIFGAKTETAVKKLQADHKLSVDGLAGNKTMQVLEALTAPKPAPAPTSGIGVNSVVTVKTSATHYADGKGIADFVKGSKHKVLQVKDWAKSYSKKAYLLDGIMGWVLEQDIVESGVSNSAPVATPAPTPVSDGSIGVIEVLVDSLNVREKADFNSRVVKVVEKGDEYKVFSQKNGLYNLGGNQWTTSNTKYVKFSKTATAQTEKKLTVLASELYTYKTADWNNKGVIVRKNEVYTVVRELMVAGSKMYQLKSGAYITANTKFVSVK